MKLAIILTVFFSIQAFGQDKRNLPFSPNPEHKPKQVERELKDIGKNFEDTDIKTEAKISPTETYKIGIGDVLEIKLGHLATKTSFKVEENGTIKFPFAGSKVIKAEGLTTKEIEELLAEGLRTDSSMVSVRVKEYNSHKITVLGLVENQGTKVLRREAVPLYVVLSEAIPQPTAKKATILRNGEKIQVALEDTDVLIYSGDVIHISEGEENKSKLLEKPKQRFYFIGGGVVSGGQKEFHDGITLTQAIVASGGLKKSSTQKAIIRRRNAQGLLESVEYDLKAIREGKKPDPELQEGDIIEIEK